MPADHETIRIWGCPGGKTQDDFFLFREVLGGGGPGRPWADGSDVVHVVPNSRNLPAEFAETRYPVLVEQLALRQDSGGAGTLRGGLGYHKRIRLLQEAALLSNADRSLAAPYGLAGGRAGGNYSVAVDRADGSRDEYPGLSDDIPINEGDVIEVITTGGGGWGDPFARDAEQVRLDVIRGVVSSTAAGEQYGVVLAEDWDRHVDVAGTRELRASLQATRGEVRMFDRGPYFDALRAAGHVARPAGWADPDGDS